MRKFKNLEKFEEDVAKQFEEDGLFFGVVCCSDCAVSATKFLIEKYPTYLTTVHGLGDGTFSVMCQRTSKEEK